MQVVLRHMSPGDPFPGLGAAKPMPMGRAAWRAGHLVEGLQDPFQGLKLRQAPQAHDQQDCGTCHTQAELQVRFGGGDGPVRHEGSAEDADEGERKERTPAVGKEGCLVFRLKVGAEERPGPPQHTQHIEETRNLRTGYNQATPGVQSMQTYPHTF